MALFQLTLMVRGGGSTHGSISVAKVVKIIEKSGLPFQLNAMATLIEGERNEVMPVVNRARLALKRESDRVYMILTMDDRKGGRRRITGKVESVEKILGRKVQRL
jgi:uncharacterized protein (TIGR00106 family)